MHQYIVFCDFDGTVTNRETAEGLWEYLLGNRFHQKMKQLIEEDATTSRGIKELFGMIPSSDYEKIFEYLPSIELRPGFTEFLKDLKSREIPFVLISGGIHEMIDHALAPFEEYITASHYCDLDHSGEYLTISSPYDDNVDLIRKERVMEEYDYQEAIYIGDSFTDLNAAQTADIIFARDRLRQFLVDKEIDNHEFETFFDIISIFEEKNLTNEKG